ncbi:phage tail assembly protein [Algicola sagamiensis]|uniref:phage tail assembly protein n=1 Tax=Algicola sagamiensis TaxID=163869 RepID=UPI00035C9ADC|nr:phage tail assembly protein [Algicola sagamiensis]
MSHDIPFELDYPVNIDGVETNQLNLRRPKGKDIKKMQLSKKDELVKSYEFFADLAGIPPSVIDEMDAEDLKKLGEMCEEMMGKG